MWRSADQWKVRSKEWLAHRAERKFPAALHPHSTRRSLSTEEGSCVSASIRINQERSLTDQHEREAGAQASCGLAACQQ